MSPGASAALGISLVLLAFVSCLADGGGTRKLRTGTPAPTPPVQLVGDGGANACQPLSSAFLTEVWAPVLAPSCLQCHGTGGPGSESNFALPMPANSDPGASLTRLQVHGLMSAWLGVASPKLGTQAETSDPLGGVVARITGDTYHGGGTVLNKDDNRLEGLQRFGAAATERENCVTVAKAPTGKRAGGAPGSNPTAATLPAATVAACQDVFKTYVAEVHSLVGSTCIACHGSGQGNLRLGVTSAQGNEAKIFHALASYALPSRTENLVNKPTAAVAHGGGQLVAPGSAEAAALGRFAESLRAQASPLAACLAQGPAASIWSP